MILACTVRRTVTMKSSSVTRRDAGVWTQKKVMEGIQSYADKIAIINLCHFREGIKKYFLSMSANLKREHQYFKVLPTIIHIVGTPDSKVGPSIIHIDGTPVFQVVSTYYFYPYCRNTSF